MRPGMQINPLIPSEAVEGEKLLSTLPTVRCFIPLSSSPWHTGQGTVGNDRVNSQFSLCYLPPALCSKTTGSEGLGLSITCNSSRHSSAFMAGGQKISSNGHHAPISSTQYSRSCGCYRGGYYQPLCFHLLVVMTSHALLHPPGFRTLHLEHQVSNILQLQVPCQAQSIPALSSHSLNAVVSLPCGIQWDLQWSR